MANLFSIIAIDFTQWILPSLVIAAAILFLVVQVVLRIFAFKKAKAAHALIRTGQGGFKVAFSNGMLVVPIIHQHKYMDMSIQKIEIEQIEKEGVICKDCLRADLKMAFFVRVNDTPDDVKTVAERIGVERATNPKTLNSLFVAKFAHAIKETAKKMEFADLLAAPEKFRMDVLMEIGRDLNAYLLEDVSIELLQQTDPRFLDPNNILDAKALEKIAQEKEKNKT